jgi:hypothetical protein
MELMEVGGVNPPICPNILLRCGADARITKVFDPVPSRATTVFAIHQRLIRGVTTGLTVAHDHSARIFDAFFELDILPQVSLLICGST